MAKFIPGTIDACFHCPLASCDYEPGSEFPSSTHFCNRSLRVIEDASTIAVFCPLPDAPADDKEAES